MPAPFLESRKADQGYELPTIEKYGDRYPNEVCLKSGGEGAIRVVKLVGERAQESHNHVSQRYDVWNAIDDALTVYIPIDEKEQKVKSLDVRKPVSIVVPAGRAVMDVFLTWFVKVFLSEPLFPYEGFEEEDMYGAALLSKILELHVIRFDIDLALHTMWRDMFAYGFGASHPVWSKKFGTKVIRSSSWFGLRTKKSKEDQVVFEGNELKNISPYGYLPDPNVPIERPWEGGYVGWISRTTRTELLRRERADPDLYFNCEYLQYYSDHRSPLAQGLKGNPNIPGGMEGFGAVKSEPVDLISMFVDIIPSEFGLGNESYPEWWLFEVTGSGVPVRAQPLNLNYGQPPIAICASNYDGKVSLPISEMEAIYGMLEVINFYFNSHVEGIRRGINSGYIVDPLGINVNDVLKPKPGMIIRTHPSRWGRGVKDVMEQLEWRDVTKDNPKDALFTLELIERVTGVNAATLGLMRGGSERRSATEAHDVFQSALGRILRSAYLVSSQAHKKIAEMFASYTQQFMTEDVFVNTVGGYSATIAEEYPQLGSKRRVKVTPDDILVNYNIVPRDNSMTPVADPQTMMMLFDLATRNPALAGNYNTVKLFTSIARQLGFRNVQQFAANTKIKAKVLPPEVVEREARAGNIAPVGDMYAA